MDGRVENHQIPYRRVSIGPVISSRRYSSILCYDIYILLIINANQQIDGFCIPFHVLFQVIEKRVIQRRIEIFILFFTIPERDIQ